MISVVIPTYNRQSLLKRILASLKGQNYRNWEIIVVDDDSTDGTAEFLRRLRWKNLTVINHATNLGPAVSRNAGIRAAQGDILASLDDDCLPAPDWLAAIDNFFTRHPQTIAVFGAVYYGERGHKGVFPERFVTTVNRAGEPIWPGTGNMAVRKKILPQLATDGKIIDTHSALLVNEDVDLAIRLSELGEVAFESSIIARHAVSFWTPPALLRSARNGATWVYLGRKYRSEWPTLSPLSKRLLTKHIRGPIVDPADYLYFLFFPVLLPILFIRFVVRTRRLPKGIPKYKLFFLKHPVFYLLKRYYIWRIALQS